MLVGKTIPITLATLLKDEKKKRKNKWKDISKKWEIQKRHFERERWEKRLPSQKKKKRRLQMRC